MTIQPFPREDQDFIARPRTCWRSASPTPTAGTWPGSK